MLDTTNREDDLVTLTVRADGLYHTDETWAKAQAEAAESERKWAETLGGWGNE